jgi:hypothetical protein
MNFSAIQWALEKVTPLVILATWEVEIGGLQFEADPSKKFVRTPSQPIKAGCSGVYLSS